MPPRLLSSGSNGSNQLAHSVDEDTYRFTLCHTPAALNDVESLAFGANHTVGLFRVGRDDADERCWEVWGSGDGKLGQLGDNWAQTGQGFRRLSLPAPPIAGVWVPTKIACGWTTTFVAFALLRPAVDVADDRASAAAKSPDPAGCSTSLLLALGSNDFSELGSGTRGSSAPNTMRRHWHVFEDEPILDLKAGPRHAMVVLGRRKSLPWRVLGWGAARHGQLACVSDQKECEGQPLVSKKYPATVDAPTLVLSSRADEAAPSIALGFAHSFVHLTSTGTLHALGAPTNAATHALPHPLSPSTEVHSTWHHLVSLQPPRTLAVQGRPSSLTAAASWHTLADVTTDPVQTVAAGSEHVVLLTAAGAVWGWGWNEHGNLGDGSTENCEVPKRLWIEGGEAPVKGVWAGCGTSWIMTDN